MESWTHLEGRLHGADGGQLRPCVEVGGGRFGGGLGLRGEWMTWDCLFLNAMVLFMECKRGR